MRKYRDKIDEIDNKLKELLKERFCIVRDIGIYKKENNIDIENRFFRIYKKYIRRNL